MSQNDKNGTEAPKSLDQAFYDALFTEALKVTPSVYTHNPPKEASYPFAQVGFVQIVPRGTKTRLLAYIHGTVEIWGDKNDRRKISSMAHDLMQRYGQIKTLPTGDRLALQVEASTVEVLPDQSTNEDLWRARLSLEYALL